MYIIGSPRKIVFNNTKVDRWNTNDSITQTMLNCQQKKITNSMPKHRNKSPTDVGKNKFCFLLFIFSLSQRFFDTSIAMP